MALQIKKHSKFTKSSFNQMIAMGTGTWYFDMDKKKICYPNFCKMFKISQADIQKMNKQLKKIRKDNAE